MTIDVGRIKERVDCRDVVERDLGKPQTKNSRYHTYKCPLHNETKGFSLVIYADRWHCYGKCDRGGDVISWLQEYHRLSFQDACQWLSWGDVPQLVSKPVPVPVRPVRQVGHETPTQPPDDSWQQAARKVAQQAMDTLWSKEGTRAWRYLQEERGLNENTILQAGLGYVPGQPNEWKTIEGLSVPCGITMPWLADGTIWGIKVRRAAGEQRYHQVRGGNIKGSLYLADQILPGKPILLTEGEFDALIAAQAGAGLLTATAIGSAANKHITLRWFNRLIAAPRLLICMDDDAAGQSAAAQIASLSQAAHIIHVPQGKDMNEFYLLAGHDAVHKWLTGLLDEVVGVSEKSSHKFTPEG